MRLILRAFINKKRKASTANLILQRVFGRLSNMKKMVLKVAIEDEKRKRRAMRAVAAVEGVESVTVDMKERKITVIGEADPVLLAKKLMKLGLTELLSVGPAKEEKVAAETPAVVYHHQLNPSYVYEPSEGYSSYTVVRNEDPNGCTIC